MERGEKKRKVRSDKRKATAPFIPDIERIWIHRIARYTGLSEGETGLRLVQEAIVNEKCIEFFASFFHRPYQFSEGVIFPGRRQAEVISDYIRPLENQERARFKIKVSQTLYLALSEFQISLATSFLAHATYSLLKYSLVDMDILQKVAPGINQAHIYGPIKTAVQVNMVEISSRAYSVMKNRRY
jgi:hypothetical protein